MGSYSLFEQWIDNWDDNRKVETFCLYFWKQISSSSFVKKLDENSAKWFIKWILVDLRHKMRKGLGRDKWGGSEWLIVYNPWTRGFIFIESRQNKLFFKYGGMINPRKRFSSHYFKDNIDLVTMVEFRMPGDMDYFVYDFLKQIDFCYRYREGISLLNISSIKIRSCKGPSGYHEQFVKPWYGKADPELVSDELYKVGGSHMANIDHEIYEMSKMHYLRRDGTPTHDAGLPQISLTNMFG